MADLVADADAALKILEHSPVYDVMISDYRLPGSLNGFDLLQMCQDRSGNRMALCLVTGDLDPEILAKAAAAGIPLAHKPLPPARLRALLTHLAGKSGRAANGHGS